MSLRHSLFALAVGSAGLLPLVAVAQDKPAEPAGEEKAETPDYAELARQLDADKFQDRQAAGLKLAEAGKAAIPALAEAAQNGSREAATRAIEILKNHFQKGDEANKAAAKEALDAIAKGENPAAARRAEEALNPKPANQNLPPGLGNLRIAPGRIQIQVQGIAGGAGGNKRVTVKNNNGVKDIEVDDNGKKVKIHDDPNDGIKIEVTEKNKEGKEETKKYEAKNVEELKKNHPEGHKIYDEYSKQPGGIQIQGIQLQPGVLPPGFPQLPVPGVPGIPAAIRPIRVRPALERPATAKIEAVQKQLEEALESLKKLEQDGAKPDSIKKLADLIEAAKKQLDEAKGPGAE